MTENEVAPRGAAAWEKSLTLILISGKISRKDAKAQRRKIMTENEVAKVVVDACYTIHTRLGPGLLESVYLRVLEYELTKRGLRVRREFRFHFGTTKSSLTKGSVPT